MSLEYKKENEISKVTITCDKCGKSQTEIEGIHNDMFYYSAWGLYPRAKKYTHLCKNCQPKKTLNK